LTSLPKPRLALVGNRAGHVPAHARLEALTPHLPVQVEWLPSEQVTSEADLAGYHGIWVIPGSPYTSKDGVLTAIRYAREQGVPYMGTCGGFQHALIEYCRTVLCIADADDVQYDPDAATPLIVPLVCSLKGQTAPLHLGAGTRIAGVYGRSGEVEETYHCQYGLNPDFADIIASSDLVISAWDEEKAPRAVELPLHPFFIATLFQPELSSTPDDIHPLIHALAAATVRHSQAA
jgi:CTP synthase (UTP-ammonia lyase)